MTKEDKNALATPLLCEVAEGAIAQGNLQGHVVEAVPPGGVAPQCDQVSSANNSDGERSASQISDEYVPAPHLVSVYEEDVRIQLGIVNVSVHVHIIVMKPIAMTILGGCVGQRRLPRRPHRRRSRGRLGG